MVELTKDERVVYKQEDGQYRMEFVQYQVYTAEARDTILKDFEKQLKDKQDWLDNYEALKQAAVDEAIKQLDIMKQKMEQDLSNCKEGIEIWKNQIKEDNGE
jgi:hypothetical protein